MIRTQRWEDSVSTGNKQAGLKDVRRYPSHVHESERVLGVRGCKSISFWTGKFALLSSVSSSEGLDLWTDHLRRLERSGGLISVENLKLSTSSSNQCRCGSHEAMQRRGTSFLGSLWWTERSFGHSCYGDTRAKTGDVVMCSATRTTHVNT